MIHTILIIDDDPAVRGAFSLILDDAGYEVHEAGGGLEGIERVKELRPDLIFLDLRMPGIDGVETLRRLKAIDENLNIYIVTAFAEEYMDQLKVAYGEGLHFQIASKPLSSAQIRNIVSSTVEPIIAAENPHHKLILTLYIVSLNDEFKQFIEQLNTALSTSYAREDWKLNIVEVLYMPEKALANDVFATPMLVRELPEPVLHVLGNLSKMPSILAAITSQHGNESDTIVM
ncbi:MAG: response regulator [Methylococcaceae bacterium]|nr:response regulator [Methylococcaceae bacterium]MDD1607389.1 response regulator [Methylococcaceae bacterium]